MNMVSAVAVRFIHTGSSNESQFTGSRAERVAFFARWQECQLPVDSSGRALLKCAPVMGQQLRKRVKRQRRDARNKRVKERLRAGMKK